MDLPTFANSAYDFGFLNMDLLGGVWINLPFTLVTTSIEMDFDQTHKTAELQNKNLSLKNKTKS